VSKLSLMLQIFSISRGDNEDYVLLAVTSAGCSIDTSEKPTASV